MGDWKQAAVVEVEPSGLTWSKSSASAGGGGSCVEVAPSGASVFIRNSRNRRGARIVVTRTTWRSLVRVAAISDQHLTH